MTSGAVSAQPQFLDGSSLGSTACQQNPNKSTAHGITREPLQHSKRAGWYLCDFQQSPQNYCVVTDPSLVQWVLQRIRITVLVSYNLTQSETRFCRMVLRTRLGVRLVEPLGHVLHHRWTVAIALRPILPSVAATIISATVYSYHYYYYEHY